MSHVEDCYAFLGLCSGTPVAQLQTRERDEVVVLAAETLRRKMDLDGLSERTGLSVKRLRRLPISQLVGFIGGNQRKAESRAAARRNFPCGTKVRCTDPSSPCCNRIGMVIGRELRAPHRSTIRWDDGSETVHPLPISGMSIVPPNGETIAQCFPLGAQVRYVWGKCHDRLGQVATVIRKNGRITVQWPDGTSPRRDCQARFFVLVPAMPNAASAMTASPR